MKTRLLSPLLRLALALPLAACGHAQTATWVGTTSSASGDWLDAANWDTGAVPDGATAVAILNTRQLPLPLAGASSPTIDAADILLAELRVVLPSAGNTQFAPTVNITGGGRLELGGAGLVMTNAGSNLVISDVRVAAGSAFALAGSAALQSVPLGNLRVFTSGLVTFDDSSRVLGDGVQLFATGPAALIQFRGSSQAGAAEMQALDTGLVVAFSGSASLGTARLHNSGVTTFQDQSTAANGTIRMAAEALTLFGGEASAGSATIQFDTGAPPSTSIVRFSGQSTGGNASVVASGGFHGAVEITELADGGQLRATNLSGLDISGAATPGGLTGRVRATTLEPSAAPVLADDARVVNVGDIFASNVGLGSNTLRLTGGTLLNIVDSGVYRAASGESLTGGRLVKTGSGTLHLVTPLPGTPYAVPLTIEQGRVVSSHRRLGNVTVQSAGRFTFSIGLVAGALENNGVLDLETANLRGVQGDFRQGPTGTLRFPVGPGHSSLGGLRLLVTGDAALAGRLEVVAPANTFGPGFALPAPEFILGAEGALSGTFSEVVVLGAPRFAVNTRYTPASVLLEYSLRPYVDFAATPAGLALAGHLDAIEGASGHSAAFRDLLVELNGVSAEALAAEIESMVPVQYPLLPTAAFGAARALRRGADERFAAARRPNFPHGWAAFFAGGARRERFDAVDGFPAARARTTQGTAGVAWGNHRFAVAASVTSEHGTLDLDGSGSRADRESLAPALQAQLHDRGLHLNATVARARDDHDLRRTFGPPAETMAGATTSAERIDWSLELGYTFGRAAWQITPRVGWLRSDWDLDAFAEHPAGGRELAFGGWSQDLDEVYGGIDLQLGLAHDRGVVRAGVLRRHEGGNGDGPTARLAGAGGAGSFVVPGRPRDRDITEGSIGLDWRIGESCTMALHAAAARGDHSRLVSDFAASVRWRF